jgi:hypothetical protein
MSITEPIPCFAVTLGKLFIGVYASEEESNSVAIKGLSHTNSTQFEGRVDSSSTEGARFLHYVPDWSGRWNKSDYRLTPTVLRPAP